MTFRRVRVAATPGHGDVLAWNNATRAWQPQSNLLAAVWPVGALFVAAVGTNPAILLGFGTWEAFGTGRVPVGIDAGQTEFDTVEKTGGEKTHTLDVTEIPAHTHTYTAPVTSNNRLIGALGNVDSVAAATASGSAGGGAAHNNLQPYIVVHMWKRTA